MGEGGETWREREGRGREMDGGDGNSKLLVGTSVPDFQSLPYGWKLSRVKAFVNFVALLPSAKVFSANFVCMRGSAGMCSGHSHIYYLSHIKSFLCEMLYFYQFVKVFTRECFRLYGMPEFDSWQKLVSHLQDMHILYKSCLSIL